MLSAARCISGWRPFAGGLWQRDYYEHVIRGDADLARIRTYIAQNPARWEA
jgi:REP element-mobilizing transposase RayT